MIDIINPYSIKILMAAKDGDSIRAISQKTNISYGWAYEWVMRLAAIAVLTIKKNKVFINRKSRIYAQLMKLAENLVVENGLDLKEMYEFPNYFGLKYAFTGTDAVFLWTKGGYNIGRCSERYPIFIEVLEQDLDEWQKLFSRFNIKFVVNRNARKKGIYYILRTKDSFEIEKISNAPVTPLNHTVEFAKKYIYNFEPALEMLDEMYGLNLGIKYKEQADKITLSDIFKKQNKSAEEQL